MKHTRYDQFELSPMHRTPEGYLLCSGRCARTGVLEYVRADGGVRRELVTEEELTRTDALGSIALKPVTDGHPLEQVTAENARQYSKGVTLNEVEYANGYVTAKILIQDAELADKVERGDVKELSQGYTIERLDETPGIHPEFGRYDAKQIGRISNHTAIVPRGRAGAQVSIRTDAVDDNDVAVYRDTREDNMNLDQLEKIKQRVDELEKADNSEEGDDEGRNDDLTNMLKEMLGAVESLAAENKALKEELAASGEPAVDEDEDGEEAGDGEDRDDEQDRLDWFNERRELVEAAKRYDELVDIDRLKNDELKHAIVKAHFGKERVDGASGNKIDGLFTAAQEIAKVQSRTDSLDGLTRAARSDSDGKPTAQDEYNQQAYGAWKTRGDSAGGVDQLADAIASKLNKGQG